MADEELDRAIALSLYESENKSSSNHYDSYCNSQEDAFFTSKPLPNHTKTSSSTADTFLSSRADQKQQRADQKQQKLQELNDEIYAKELDEIEKRQQSQNMSSSSSSSQNLLRTIFNLHFSPSNTSDIFSNNCKKCNKSIQGRYLLVNDQKFHPNCFCCYGCHQPLESRYMIHEVGSEKEYYHLQCYKELFTPKCNVCSKVLEGRYMTHGYFRDIQNYCPEHEGLTKQCFSCALKEPQTDPYPELPDGRVICWRCIDTIVVDTDEARPLYLEAVDFMNTVLGLPIPRYMRQVTVLAVDISTLNEQNNIKATTSSSVHPNCPSDLNRFGTSGTFSGSTTRGLTLTTVSEVRYISPGNLQWGDFFRNAQNHRQNQFNGSNIQFPTVRLDRTCSVTAVLVLCGLPRDLTASILAHEAMHVWCKLRESDGRAAPLLDLPSIVEEGLCQYVAYRYLDHLQTNNETRKSSTRAAPSNTMMTKATHMGSETWQEKLVPYFKYQIESDPSSIYGEGFRRVATCCSMIGFENTLDYIIQHRDFPNL